MPTTQATPAFNRSETPGQSELISPPPLPPPVRTAADVRAALDRSAWNARKQLLIRKPEFAWLGAFDGDVSVDSIVYDVTSKLLHVEPPYDPYQIESLVSSASSLLDRCLTYRREMYDLEERAVRRALEYQLFNDQYDAQLNIELAAPLETQMKLQHNGQSAGYTAFKSATGDALAPGFAAITDGSAQSSQVAITAEQDRKKYVNTKWEKLKEFQIALQARHNTPGHSLNYGERFNRTRAFLEQDIAVAYQKAKCIAAAAHEIFGIARTLDELTEFGYLDILVMFLRNSMEDMQNATIEEVDFEHIVSVRQLRYLPSGQTIQIIDDAHWRTAVNEGPNSGLLTIGLRNEFPEAVQRLRVRGIGLSVLWEDFQPEDRLRSISAVVFPPQVKNLFSPDSYKNRPPVVIEKIRAFDPNENATSSSPTVGNIDPRGEWRIQLSSNIITSLMYPAPHDPNAYPQTTGRNCSRLMEVKLHLRLSAILDKSPAKWADLSW